MTVRVARLPLALLVDVLWGFAAVAVFVAVLGHGEGPGPSILGVTAIVIGSFAVARALQETQLGDGQFKVAGVSASIIAIFAVIHIEYAAQRRRGISVGSGH